jgi:hypothetical protein
MSPSFSAANCPSAFSSGRCFNRRQVEAPANLLDFNVSIGGLATKLPALARTTVDPSGVPGAVERFRQQPPPLRRTDGQSAKWK